MRVFELLKKGMDAARDNADAQKIANHIVLPLQAYEDLYYAAYRAKRMFEGAQCDKCTPREQKAMRALESLTPSGSEFVDEVDRCVAFVTEQRDLRWQHIIRLTIEVKALRAQVAQLQEASNVKI